MSPFSFQHFRDPQLEQVSLVRAVFYPRQRPPIFPEGYFKYYSWQWLAKEMVTHSIILAWKLPWTEEPCGLPSMGSQRVRHDWVRTHIHPVDGNECQSFPSLSQVSDTWLTLCHLKTSPRWGGGFRKKGSELCLVSLWSWDLYLSSCCLGRTQRRAEILKSLPSLNILLS